MSVAFDLPTQIGLDSDDPLAAGEVGKVGVAIDSFDDMLTLLDGIPLDQGVDLDDDKRNGVNAFVSCISRLHESKACLSTRSAARSRTTF